MPACSHAFNRGNGGRNVQKVRRAWWARQGLNLRPHPCEGGRIDEAYSFYGGYGLSNAKE